MNHNAMNSSGINREASVGDGGESDAVAFDRDGIMGDWEPNGMSLADKNSSSSSSSYVAEYQPGDYFGASGGHHDETISRIPNRPDHYTQQPLSFSHMQQQEQQFHEVLPQHIHVASHHDFLENHKSMTQREHDHSIDKFLANELNQLSFQERNYINEVIHGVSSLYSIDETPELISESIEQLQIEIDQNIPIQQKLAYETSKKIYNRKLQINQEQQGHGQSSLGSSSNGYVNDPDFILLFLRRERFVVHKAALRLVNFMDLVYELYGENALTQKVWESQSVLNKVELDVLRSGPMQCLQGRDRAGRRIVGQFALDISELSVQSRLRLSLFCTMAVLDDVETQKKGAVGITTWHNVSIDDFHKRGQCHKRISDAFPIRLSAIHLCLPHHNSCDNDPEMTQTPNPQLLRLIKAMFVMSIGSENRPHLRVHIGSTVECIYALQSFGILPEQIPLNSTTGKVKTKFHHKWLELRLQKEIALKENKSFNKIECPMIQDVLFGRGWPIMKHPGNVIFRHIIDSKLEEYQNENTKRGKTLIACSVVSLIKQKGNGGRFLKEDSGWWVEVSNDMARQKVSIAFRDARKLKSRQESKTEKAVADVAGGGDGGGGGGGAKRRINRDRDSLEGELSNDSSTSAFLGLDGSSSSKRHGDTKKQRCFCIDLMR